MPAARHIGDHNAPSSSVATSSGKLPHFILPSNYLLLLRRFQFPAQAVNFTNLQVTIVPPVSPCIIAGSAYGSAQMRRIERIPTVFSGDIMRSHLKFALGTPQDSSEPPYQHPFYKSDIPTTMCTATDTLSKTTVSMSSPHKLHCVGGALDKWISENFQLNFRLAISLLVLPPCTL